MKIKKHAMEVRKENGKSLIGNRKGWLEGSPRSVVTTNPMKKFFLFTFWSNKRASCIPSIRKRHLLTQNHYWWRYMEISDATIIVSFKICLTPVWILSFQESFLPIITIVTHWIIQWLTCILKKMKKIRVRLVTLVKTCDKNETIKILEELNWRKDFDSCQDLWKLEDAEHWEMFGGISFRKINYNSVARQTINCHIQRKITLFSSGRSSSHICKWYKRVFSWWLYFERFPPVVNHCDLLLFTFNTHLYVVSHLLVCTRAAWTDRWRREST